MLPEWGSLGCAQAPVFSVSAPGVCGEPQLEDHCSNPEGLNGAVVPPGDTGPRLGMSVVVTWRGVGLLALSGWEQGGCSSPRSAQDWGPRVGLMRQRFYLRGSLWLLWGGQATGVKGQSPWK